MADRRLYLLLLVLGALYAGFQLRTIAAARLMPSGKIYVADTFGDDVGVLDAKTGARRAEIPTGKLPHNFALTRDRKTLYVTESGSQSVQAIDTTTDRPLRQRIVGPVPDVPAHRAIGLAKVGAAASCKSCHLPRPVGTFISGVALSPDESELWITEMKTGRLLVADAKDLATKKRVALDTPTPSTPSNVLPHPVTKDVWVLARKMKGHPGVPGVRDHGTAAAGGHGRGGFDHDPRGPGASWIVVYDPTLTHVKARIRVEHAVPYQGVFSPDGRELYVSYRSTDKVVVIDTEKRAVARTYTVDEAPIGMVLAPDDETLAVACFYEVPATVVFLDRRTGAIRHRLQVPSSPVLLRRHPGNGLLYLTASGANKIVEIDPWVPAVKRVLDAGAFPVDLELVP
jgi:YVTN family beta-propeller protein